jgi:uracil-DNA glycosylase
MHTLNNDWASALKEEFTQPYYLQLKQFIEEQYQTEVVYPAQNEIFSALEYTSLKQVKVVIIGQDPYHGSGQAHGLSFSVKPGVQTPPSLKNIFKELHTDIGLDIPNHGSLVPWTRQGVLMLNTVLTVRKGSPNSHKEKGWEMFTDKVISILNNRERPIVFMLWGKHAQEKLKRIHSDRHCIIQSAHPSPFAARKGFFGSKPFSRANAYLKEIGSSEIDWKLENPQ